MADVRDVLGLSGAAGGAPGPASASASAAGMGSPRGPVARSAAGGLPGARPAGASATRAPEVPRELAQLRSEFIGAGPVPMAPTPPLGAFKAKRVKAVSWKCLPIRSSARTASTGKPEDDLDLKHWVKIHNVPDYRFARFNKAIKMLEYSHEEYERYCHDPAWSRPETDRLMDLAKKLDLRFILMQDRYNAMSEAAAARVRSEPLPDISEERLEAARLKLTGQQSSATTESKEDTEANQPTTAAPTVDTTVAAPTNDSIAAPAPPAAEAASTPMDTSAATDAASANPTAASPAPSVASSDVAIAASASPTDSSAAAPATFPSILPSAAATSRPTAIGGVFEERSVEQLKSRFYFIQQSLTQLRNASDPDLRKTNPLFTHPYDSAHELLRKAQLERLYQRKADEIDEMAQIVLEHRNISSQIQKIKKSEKENRDVLRGYKTGGTKSGGRAGSTTTAASAASGNKKKAIKLPRQAVPLGELAPLPTSCDASAVVPSREDGSVFLRSSQLAHPLNASTKQQKHLENELTQLNVKRLKDVPVPTGVVCDLWDKLRVNILTLVNLQQYVRDKETTRDDLRLHAAATLPAAALHAPAPRPQMDYSAAPVSSPPGMAPQAGGQLTGAAAAAAQAQAQALAARKKQEKRRLEGTEGASEQDDKRAKKK